MEVFHHYQKKCEGGGGGGIPLTIIPPKNVKCGGGGGGIPLTIRKNVKVVVVEVFH